MSAYVVAKHHIVYLVKAAVNLKMSWYFDGEHYPFCQTDLIFNDGEEWECLIITQFMRCGNCKAVWTEVFRFAAIYVGNERYEKDVAW